MQRPRLRTKFRPNQAQTNPPVAQPLRQINAGIFNDPSAHLAEGAQARYHPLGARLGEHGYLGAGAESERAETEPELLGQVVHFLEIQEIAAVVAN